MLSGLFWIFTYVLLSIRAGLIPEAVPVLVTPQRLVAITAGATIFFAAARHLLKTKAQPCVTTTIGTFAVSVVAAVIIRLGLDQMALEQAPSVSYSVRWTLVWAGYFGVWLIGTLAYFDSAPTVIRIETKALAKTIPTADPDSTSTADELAWGWLVDVLAGELAQSSPANRLAIATRLIAAAGYEESDPLDTSAQTRNVRAKLAQSIASRI